MITRKIAICDDEFYVQELLYDYLKKLEITSSYHFEIQRFSSGEALLQDIMPDTDILLLDIKMKHLSGMNAARKLRESGINCCIIFITSMIQYALEGYEVHAFAFIQKPCRYPQFERTMLDALRMQDIRTANTLSLRRGSAIDTINISHILYAETLDHVSSIVTVQGKQEYMISLKKLSAELIPYGFGLCHKSFLVNFRQIRSILPNELLITNRHTIPLSKHRKKEFLEQFTAFMGEQL